MTLNKKTLRSAIALCLLACLLVSLAACAKQEPEETTDTEPQTFTYTIEIKNQGGKGIAGVGIYVYTDSTLEELVWFDRTDDAGAMTFSDQASDSYVAVLSDVPAGYLAEESYALTGETTQIVLEADMTAVEDPTSLTYALGDVMQDFTVIAADGAEYTLSELLAEKEAVLLNFWYGACQPCQAEFPYLQEAYEHFSDTVAVLALNPVDADDESIAQFQSDLGLTFPMAHCDIAWEEALQITGYPTTVVIDRYGIIGLIHRGSVPDAQTFLNIFAYFADEAYQQGTVEDVESLPAYEIEEDPTDPEETEPTVPETTTGGSTTNPTSPTSGSTTNPTSPTTGSSTKPTSPTSGGSTTNPTSPTTSTPTLDTTEYEVLEFPGQFTFDVTVKPWKVAYVNLYKISEMILAIKDPDVCVIYNGVTYNASNGAVYLTLKSDDPFNALKIGIGNKSNTEKTFTATLSNPPGTWNNPYTMSLGNFSVKVAGSSEQGVYYDYVATESGTLTLQCLSVSPTVDFAFFMQVISESRTVATNRDVNATTVSIQVQKGERVRLNVGVLPEQISGTTYTLEFQATFTAG